jgi:integrase
MNKYENVINSSNNEKHRFILALLYKLRLTTGMIINLQVRDIQNNILYCRGKRIFIPDSLMHDFYKFIQNKNPEDYLVESGWNGNKPHRDNKQYSISTINCIRKKALKKCKHTGV